MKLNKQQKIYLGVLAAVLVALGADRLVLSSSVSGAEGASAELVYQEPEQQELVQQAADELSRPQEVRVPMVTARLRRVRQSHQLSVIPAVDVFRPAAAWKSPDDSGGPDAPSARRRQAIEEFVAAHSLTAVMSNGDGGFAIIGGKTVRPGHEIDGFTVTAIRDRSVELTSGAIRIELTLKVDEPQAMPL